MRLLICIKKLSLQKRIFYIFYTIIYNTTMITHFPKKTTVFLFSSLINGHSCSYKDSLFICINVCLMIK